MTRTNAIRIVHEEEAPEVAVEERLGALWGASPAMRHLFDQIRSVAPQATTVLLQGETGSGKELAAEEIHRRSPRRNGPFVVLDCAGLPTALIEDELFGHDRGAFSGAVEPRAGALEQASGGTLFLDEIADLPLLSQSKLLRAIEARRVKRLGSDEWKPVDLRVICAASQDLAQLCKQRRFRQDLYFRIAVVSLRIPALRERLEDLPLLIRAILAEAGQPCPRWLDEQVLESLRARSWVGNVRELRNVVQRALALGPSVLFEDNDQPIAHEEEAFRIAKARVVEDFERRYLLGLLHRVHGNVAKAARVAQVDPAWIFRLVKKHQIDVSRMRHVAGRRARQFGT